MAQVGKGQEFNEQERRSVEFIENLSKIGWPEKDEDDCVPLQPSKHWSMIKAVNFKKDRPEKILNVQASFTSKNLSGARYKERSTFMPSMRSGRRAHGVLHEVVNQVIKKVEGEKGGVDLEPEEKQLLQGFVEDIEKHFGFKFKASELKIHGYTKKKMDDDIHCWRGKIDAIGVMKNGTVVIVDWVVPRYDFHEFWDLATKFSGKLHQTMIYREIIRAQWRDSYKCEKDIPTVGILIVPISTKSSDPRWCLDFKALQEAEFFDEINGMTWTAQKPSKTDKVRWESPCDKVKQKPSEVLQKSPPDISSENIKQESAVNAEGEEYSRKHKTPDGDCGNRMRIISEPLIPLYHAREIKQERKPVAVKQQEPIRQMPDRPHLSGRTPTDSYRAAEMYDTRNAAVGRVTQMPDLQHHIARTPVHWYYTPEEALQLHSSNIQPGISAAQMVYRESAELEPYHFIEKTGCSCYGRKKCAHAQGAGQCDCKAAGKKCGYYCDCDEQICTNRELMNIKHKEEDYSRNYTAFDDDYGYRGYMAGCSCHGRKSAPMREAQVNVIAKLQGRNAGITATAMRGYAQTGHGNEY